MIIKGDAKALEWRSYVELSQDPVGLEEILAGADVHANNQQRFLLPSRLIAKRFLFRWIYRGSAYAYSVDNDFAETGGDVKYWQGIIDTANQKYKVLYEYQNSVIEKARRREVVSIPSGREWSFEMYKNKKGIYDWNIKQITNYINQGFGNDLMALARVSFKRKLGAYSNSDYCLFNTVHDDIEADVANDPELCYNISMDMLNSFESIPENFERWYKKPFKTPMTADISFGPNLLELKAFDRTKGKEQFYAD